MRLTQRTFSRLYDQFAPKIYRFVFFKVGSPEVAQDITSEVFLKTWQYWQQNQKVRHPQAMFYQVARHQVADFYRKNKYQMISLEANPLAIIDDSPPLSEVLAQEEEAGAVWKALCSLREDYREVLVWRYLDSFSYGQIARILQKPKATVRVIVHRALKNLKQKV